jgi:hypothetical protein
LDVEADVSDEEDEEDETSEAEGNLVASRQALGL